jgi:hypothetical protein
MVRTYVSIVRDSGNRNRFLLVSCPCGFRGVLELDSLQEASSNQLDVRPGTIDSHGRDTSSDRPL